MRKFSIFKRKYLFALSAVFAFALIACAIASLAAPSAYADSNNQQSSKRVMNVSGQGIVKAEPDIADITIGVVTENENAQAAQKANAEIMNKVISAIKSKGIDEKDIKTDNYNISPKYKYNQNTGENTIYGYTVSNNVRVRVRDINLTGAVIDAASQNGANQTYNISFSLSDYEKYYNEALKKAVESAKGHAQTIADTLGVKLSVPTSVTESGYSAQPPTIYRNENKVADYAQNSTPISAGTLEVTASVSMSYEY